MCKNMHLYCFESIFSPKIFLGNDMLMCMQFFCWFDGLVGLVLLASFVGCFALYVIRCGGMDILWYCWLLSLSLVLVFTLVPF